MKNRLYIAYGSNLNREQMLHRCPDAVIVGTAVLKDYRMLFRKSGTGFYLTVEPKKGSTVPVAIWSVTSDDETRLDGYEGYPVCYYKKEVTLDVLNPNTGKSRRRHCFFYAMYANRQVSMFCPECLGVIASSMPCTQTDPSASHPGNTWKPAGKGMCISASTSNC